MTNTPKDTEPFFSSKTENSKVNEGQRPKKTLTLSATSGGGQKHPGGTGPVVRQQFSHGRSKMVVVEVKRNRASGQEEVQEKGPSIHENGLTDQERDARRRALEEALAAEKSFSSAPRTISGVLSEQQQETQEPGRAESSASTKEPLEDKPASQVISLAPEEEILPSVQGKEGAGSAAADKRRSHVGSGASSKISTKEVEEVRDKNHAEAAKRQSSGSKQHVLRRTLQDLEEEESFINLQEESEVEVPVVAPSVKNASIHRQAALEKPRWKGVAPAHRVIRRVEIPPQITVQDLAAAVAQKVQAVLKTLRSHKVVVEPHDTIEGDLAYLIVEELGHIPVRVDVYDIEKELEGPVDTAQELKARPPVVTIMGHVDHGKTSLLDALRRTNVAQGEAGGITQHIGAYQVKAPSGQEITFVDTPGHGAFTSMRARGASITDIVVLVVAADDGVKEQTVEAIGHAKAAGVALIVAINKIDKPEARPDHVRQMLLSHEIVVEQFGGDILDVEISAKTGLNLDKLLEAILVQAELLELKANPSRPGQGRVLEARLDKGRGPIATLLVQRGTLKVGDSVVAGTQWGKVRAVYDSTGKSLRQATPSMPVEIWGLGGVPAAGDAFHAVENEAFAKKVAQERIQRQKEASVKAPVTLSLEHFFKQSETVIKELPVVVKADVYGSLEAVVQALSSLSHEEVELKIVHKGVGPVTESDVLLAKASHGIVVAFNTKIEPNGKTGAAREKVLVINSSLIYDLVDQVKLHVLSLVKPVFVEKKLGTAVVRQVFNVSKMGKIAGSYVEEGIIKRGASLRLIRNNQEIFKGQIKTLKRLKDDVKEAKEGYECGIGFDSNDIEVGDRVECFELQQEVPGA